ncbi:MAG TPA: SsrA-binding protein SmpB [Rhodothermales bacterium]|nr:SsrA-binding protein SmpB [Rhodothermales bacterium]
MAKQIQPDKTIMTNRRARHEYHIEDEYEAGIVLTGTEVKSIRDGKINLQDAFCDIRSDGAYLIGAHISPYSHGGQYFNHEPVRGRRLLLHSREIKKMARAKEQKGYTLVPLSVYLKNKRIKIAIGVAKGKKLYDKRETIAERDSARELDRVRKSSRRSDDDD